MHQQPLTATAQRLERLRSNLVTGGAGAPQTEQKVVCDLANLRAAAGGIRARYRQIAQSDVADHRPHFAAGDGLRTKARHRLRYDRSGGLGCPLRAGAGRQQCNAEEHRRIPTAD